MARSKSAIASNRAGRRARNAALALAALLVPGGLAAAAERAAADPNASGADIAAQVCASCHGPEGNAPPGDVPNLAGQQAGFLRRQLHAFKNHARSSETAAQNMWPVAHALNERQIDELVAYFSTRKPRTQPVEGNAKSIAAGQAIFARGSAARGVPSCAGCHGADGSGRDGAPRLAGQHVGYLTRQLRIVQQTNDRPGAMAMRPVAHELTPEEIASVAAYLQALPSVGAR